MIKRNSFLLALVILCALLAVPAQVLAINAATTVSRVSTDSAGVEGNAGTGNAPAVSADGRYVAFTSSATNLVAGDTNGADDTFLKDTITGTTIRVSTDSVGAQGNAASVGSPSISEDGRYVVFSSSATNLVASDTNAFADVFVKDTQTGTTTRVSTDSVGAQGNSLSVSYWTSMSGGGRYVVFLSFSTNLVASDTNATSDIFVKDLQTGTTSRISTDSSGVQGNGAVSNSSADISTDGRYVTFGSAATNMVAGDSNAVIDIFRKDTVSGTTIRVSTDSSAAQSNAASVFPAMSADGRYISYDSTATNLVSGDTNAVGDVFLKDVQTDITTRVSTDSIGAQGSALSQISVLSADGRYILYRSDATNLVADDTNAARDSFMKDTISGTTVRISTGIGGVQGNGTIIGGMGISGDNNFVAFVSDSSNLVASDTNAVVDMFYRLNALVLVTSDDDFTASAITAGGKTPSVLANDLQNGAPANSADYTLSISGNDGLLGLTINADGTMTIPSNASAGIYTITYQACEVVSPATCYTATATLSVSILAETGSNVVPSVFAGLLIAVSVVAFRRKNVYSIKLKA